MPKQVLSVPCSVICCMSLRGLFYITRFHPCSDWIRRSSFQQVLGWNGNPTTWSLLKRHEGSLGILWRFKPYWSSFSLCVFVAKKTRKIWSWAFIWRLYKAVIVSSCLKPSRSLPSHIHLHVLAPQHILLGQNREPWLLMNNFLFVQPTLWGKAAKPATLQNWGSFLASYRILSTPLQDETVPSSMWPKHLACASMTTTPCAGMQSTKKRSRTASQNSSQRDIVITVIPSLGPKNSVSTKAWNSMVHVLHQSPFIRSASAPEHHPCLFLFEWFSRHWHF